MDIIAQFQDKEIAKVIDPTVAAFAPLLKKKKTFIQEIPTKSFKYGNTDRHQLDVYYPLEQGSRKKTPILFFIYGGGFNTGERSISPKTFGLVYACVGAFYARRGYIVVVPDYRLVPHITYPAPAEDVRDAVRWVVAHADECLVSPGSPSPDLEKIALMGHSAGAAHVATMVWDTNVLAEDDELRKRIVATILESPPYDLSMMTVDWPTAPIHIHYYGGTIELVHANAPMLFYRKLSKSFAETLPKILMVEGENEPDWLLDAGVSFHKEVKDKTGEDVKKIVAKGHNHISLNWALSTGVGEDWAEELVEWLDKLVAQ
ncbi:putative carboxylesterase 7 [Psilocybe cubensis]|uniref:Carboxylesterase 7 n=2 Tax=Psilocybe cubensis TaxID=181762 RepID=A0ACB8GHV7_PSICU|nr:putative carboxylesterase 7 [Psilocybe cubensis]KAH9475194.1 putative carboxylesterase 7 [Psilocybe cubensis]